MYIVWQIRSLTSASIPKVQYCLCTPCLVAKANPPHVHLAPHVPQVLLYLIHLLRLQQVHRVFGHLHLQQDLLGHSQDLLPCSQEDQSVGMGEVGGS